MELMRQVPPRARYAVYVRWADPAGINLSTRTGSVPGLMVDKMFLMSGLPNGQGAALAQWGTASLALCWRPVVQHAWTLAPGKSPMGPAQIPMKQGSTTETLVPAKPR